MMVLALNCGSSSVKFRLFEVDPAEIAGWRWRDGKVPVA